MKTTEIRPFVRNMSAMIPGLFVCLMFVPSPSHADPFWSIGFSGGSSGISCFTFSISDYCRMPVYVDHSGPPCGQAHGYYEKYPRYQNNHRPGVPPHSLSGPDGRHRTESWHDQYRQDMDRAHPRIQSFSRADGLNRNSSRQDTYNRNTTRQNQSTMNFSRPDGYRQAGYRNSHSVQGMGARDKGTQRVSWPNREKQRQWEMKMMNMYATYPR